MLPSVFVLVLSALLAVRWGILLIRKRELRNVFTFLARLYFAAIYCYITFATPESDMRSLVRIGLTVLFLDEILNWLSVPFFTWCSKTWADFIKLWG